MIFVVVPRRFWLRKQWCLRSHLEHLSSQQTSLWICHPQKSWHDDKFLVDSNATWLVDHDTNEVSLCQLCLQLLFRCLWACWNHFLNFFVAVVSSYYVGSTCFIKPNQWAEPVYRQPLTTQLILCDVQLWNLPSSQCCLSLKRNIVTLSRPVYHVDTSDWKKYKLTHFMYVAYTNTYL